MLFGRWSGIIGIRIRVFIRLTLRDVRVKWLERSYLLDFYNLIITEHAIVIIFFTVIPIFLGAFGNWIVPLFNYSSDLIFPRMNRLRFWVIPVRFWFFLRRIIIGDWGRGWTLYPPLRIMPKSSDLLILSLHLAGISSIISSINFLVSILFDLLASRDIISHCSIEG